MIIRDKDDIESFLYEKFKDWKKDDFFIKDKSVWGEDSITDFDGFVEHLAEVVEQHLVDEDFDWQSNMPEIDAKQWDKWTDEYAVPEPECPRCGGGRGCNYCLMTGY